MTVCRVKSLFCQQQGAGIDRASQTDKNRSKAARALRTENSIFATLRPLRGSASLVIVLALGPLQETDCARLKDQKAVIRVRRCSVLAKTTANAAEQKPGKKPSKNQARTFRRVLRQGKRGNGEKA